MPVSIATPRGVNAEDRVPGRRIRARSSKRGSDWRGPIMIRARSRDCSGAVCSSLSLANKAGIRHVKCFEPRSEEQHKRCREPRGHDRTPERVEEEKGKYIIGEAGFRQDTEISGCERPYRRRE